ncbi:protein of unknown function (DUF397) [Streptomyces sp. SceaMP-e96]|uniref:DUF397 domain-containing protein n=1 Tax=unclassified Streptomyces TaxID=2593676 RepID=UPI000823F86D|nr:MULTISPECIES: DUF397 domain-containing protein [unclassified Streptomyces]MYT13575.1 DUF397 domain-containing protein [Streptomyces sp. SID4951]SCK52777.1 protein of unknown function (DUF397) [Streptomyces sp. SceaMP-e96]
MTSTAAQHFSRGLNWFKSSYSGSAGGDCIEVAYEWRKSSYSASEGGNCIEVAYDWHKSTYSGSAGGDCVEVATCPHAIHIRDSKNPGGPILTLGAAAWSAFLADVAN